MPTRFLLALAALLAAAPSAHAYDLRGARLGMPIGEFRKLQIAEVAGAKIVCSTDPEAKHLRPTPEQTPTAEDAKRGVTGCGFFRFGKVLGEKTSVLPPEWVSAPIRIADVASTPTFWFMPDPQTGGTPRLFRITLRSNALNWDKYWSDFTRRHGPPTFDKRERFSTVPTGGHLDNVIGIWDDGTSSITLTKYAGRASQMTVEYLDKQVAWSLKETPG